MTAGGLGLIYALGYTVEPTKMTAGRTRSNISSRVYNRTYLDDRGQD